MNFTMPADGLMMWGARASADIYWSSLLMIYLLAWMGMVNSLAPGKFQWNFRHVFFKEILVIDGWGISCEIALIWMSLDFTDDQSTLVQVMAWCHQATSHYLRSQCWPRSLLPYKVTRPQWVNLAMVYGLWSCYLLFLWILCNMMSIVISHFLVFTTSH